MRSAWKGNELPPSSGGVRTKLPECCPNCHLSPPFWKALGVCAECKYVATTRDLVPDYTQRSVALKETAATPMPSMKIGLAKAGSLAKSLGTNAKAPSTSLAGSVPSLGSKGSSFAENLIMQVAAGRSPQDVVSALFEGEESSIERQASMVSPAGSAVTTNVIRPGMHIGIRGPVHNGFHTVDTVQNGMVTMKCETGRMVTVSLASLENHEVVHALENV